MRGSLLLHLCVLFERFQTEQFSIPATVHQTHAAPRHPPTPASPRYEPSALEVAREVPLPTLEELGGYLPSQRFPSDHLPVVFDLRFKAEGAGSDAGSTGAAASAAAGGVATGSSGSSGAPAGGGSAPPAGAGNLLPAALYNVGSAADALQRDEVIAVPTDTLYGLASCANSSRAVRHIYATKRRQDHKPLAIAVADVADVPRYGDTQVGGQGSGWGSWRVGGPVDGWVGLDGLGAHAAGAGFSPCHSANLPMLESYSTPPFGSRTCLKVVPPFLPDLSQLPPPATPRLLSLPAPAGGPVGGPAAWALHPAAHSPARRAAGRGAQPGCGSHRHPGAGLQVHSGCGPPASLRTGAHQRQRERRAVERGGAGIQGEPCWALRCVGCWAQHARGARGV